MIKSLLKAVIKALIIVVIALILSFVILFLIELKKSDGNATKATVGVLNKVADSITECEPVYVLVLGVNDSINQSLTDTMMLMGYNPQTQKAFIVSIPRDTFVGKNINKATANDKINSLYSKSPKDAMEAVENLMGVKINYYVAINNDALIQIIDIIGGVEFDVPIDMNYDDSTQNLHIHLKKGIQILDGKKAEQLLRFRHNNNGTSYSVSYGDNDYGRMKTGREFIFTVINQCLQTKSIDEITQIIKIVFNNLKTDCSLSYILSYLVYAYEFNTDNLILEQVPGESIFSNEVWIFKHNKSETQDLMNNILQDFYEE